MPGDEVPQELSFLAHRRWIGYLGFLMPILLVSLAGLRFDPNSGVSQPLGSISAYYYTGAVAIFAGILFALSGFLVTYRGYTNSRADHRLGIFSGLCALGVALFPTEAPPGFSAPDWWSDVTGTIHYVSAVLLFCSFIAFSVWLFRRTDVPKGQPLPPDKQRRNSIFLACGIVMMVAVAWAGIAGATGRSIFWQEAIALWAFALSWLIKGEAPKRAVALAKQAKQAVVQQTQPVVQEKEA